MLFYHNFKKCHQQIFLSRSDTEQAITENSDSIEMILTDNNNIRFYGELTVINAEALFIWSTVDGDVHISHEIVRHHAEVTTIRLVAALRAALRAFDEIINVMFFICQSHYANMPMKYTAIFKGCKK